MSMHLTDGEIRAYVDNELDTAACSQVQAHLASCAQCQQRSLVLSQRAAMSEQRLDALNPGRQDAALPVQRAQARFQAILAQKENPPMFQRIFNPRARTAWATLGVVAILAASLAFPQVRAIANSFLGLFRVQQITVVQVNPGNLPEQLGSSSQLEALLSQNVTIEESGETQPAADAAEASRLAGIPVRLPLNIQDAGELKVQPGGKMSFNVNTQQIRAVLDEIGRRDIELPEGLDGAQVSMAVPKSVAAFYGDCEADLQAARQQGYDPDDPSLPRLPNCTTLVQMPSPDISAPPGLDLASIGEAFLQLMGMTQAEAQSFSRNVDWTTTFVLPIPRYGTSYQDLQVDGVTGTLIEQELEDHSAQYMLLWVREGILYALAGPGGEAEALAIGNSLK